ncbi:hypothetical protein ABD87_23040 [Lysinibacillus sphaericus]|uniref:hypothetical protein n=1 Tax=Lysinibacillus sphaericus TaxID=1421 RepID=UPI0018CDA766|nr:hypothetical protein [Lysinibacillus sphaericus]MBG9732303.1 hypothetical protein [Lysinibacillus sphaericus]
MLNSHYYPTFYLLQNNEEIEYRDLKCPKCGTKAEDMYDEADTQLICKCNKRYLQVIWDEEGLMKRHRDIYRKYGIEISK